MGGQFGCQESVPIVGGRVGAAVDLLRGHVAVRDGEHALLLQHLLGPGPSATRRRQRHGQPPPGQRPGPQRRRHVLQLPVQVEFPETGIRPGPALVARRPGRVGRGRRRRRGRCKRVVRSPPSARGLRRRRARRPQPAAGARTAACLLDDGAVEQVPARHAGRPARTVRRPGAVPVVVAATPSVARPQTRTARLRARVRLRLSGYVRARQTPRLQFGHQLLLFFRQEPMCNVHSDMSRAGF